MRTFALALLCAGLLAACSKEVPPPPKAEAPRPGVFDDQLKQLERAKAVQGQMDDAAKQQAQRIQEAEGK